MASLDISFLSGKTQEIELSKQQPISVGSHASNDLQIENDGVAAMQCRISWNKNYYEAVAATSDGIEINGIISGRSQLQDGDLIRIGEADIRFVDEIEFIDESEIIEESDVLDNDIPQPDVSGENEGSLYDLKPTKHSYLELEANASAKSPQENSAARSKSGKTKKRKRTQTLKTNWSLLIILTCLLLLSYLKIWSLMKLLPKHLSLAPATRSLMILLPLRKGKKITNAH